MEFIWLYTLCQCTLSVSVIVFNVRLCMAVSTRTEGTQAARGQLGSVSCCLRLCLGYVGAVGGALGVPVTVLLNLRTPQCLYTCITLVCSPLLIRQFTMFLLMLLTLDVHLQHNLADRYSLVVTRRRALCAVLLCWVGSVLSSFAQFIGTDVLHTWTNGRTDPGTDDHGLDGNWTTSVPHHTTTPLPKYYQDRKVIAKYLPYGGFLSKFYVEDKHNFTYAEIHSSHWGVCAPDTVLSPQFVVYVHGITVFILPLLFLIVIYFVLLCTKLKKALINHDETIKHKSHMVHFIAFSICLLVLLCLPLYVIEALLLFTPDTHLPPWACAVALFFFQLYSLVPPILFTPPRRRSGDEQVSLPLAVPNLTAAVVRSKGKSVRMALREVVQSAPWSSAKHSLKAKVCPEV